MSCVAWLVAPALFHAAQAASLPHMPGTARYEGYNCFEHNGGHKLELDSGYANPFPNRFPVEECYQRCLEDGRCQAFQIVRRHIEEGHPPPGPCWLRTDIHVDNCLRGAAQGAEPYDLFVINDARPLSGSRTRYGRVDVPVRRDPEYIPVTDRVERTVVDYRRECTSSKYDNLKVSGLKGYAKWGNGKYKEMGHKCSGGHTYWQKKGDDAYVYRIGDRWYIGDHVCSTSKYWAKRSATSRCPDRDLYTVDSELGSKVKLSSKKSKPEQTSTWVSMTNVLSLPIAITTLSVSLLSLFGFSRQHSRDPTPDPAPAAPKPAPQPYVPAYRPDPNSFTTVESVRLDKSRLLLRQDPTPAPLPAAPKPAPQPYVPASARPDKPRTLHVLAYDDDRVVRTRDYSKEDEPFPAVEASRAGHKLKKRLLEEPDVKVPSTSTQLATRAATTTRTNSTIELTTTSVTPGCNLVSLAEPSPVASVPVNPVVVQPYYPYWPTSARWSQFPGGSRFQSAGILF